MGHLSIVRFGLSLGAASAVFYLGCVLLMMTLPEERVVAFFNSLRGMVKSCG